MTQSSKKNRIIFIDLIRAFAVLQMVQGHTVDLLLADSYRNPESVVYNIWFFMRGMTAPIFLFTSGTVFTYLYRLHNESFLQNPRTKKGAKRFLLLVFLGYMLRYPTATVVDFSEVTKEQWITFLSVDVLQLIGFGILFILLLVLLNEWLQRFFKWTENKDYYIFGLFALLFFTLAGFFEFIKWKDFLPVAIAGYFYKDTGSLFPLFPWAGFVIAGGILGSFLAKNPTAFKTSKFSRNLAITGAILLVISYIVFLIAPNNSVDDYAHDASLSLALFRLGFVVLLNSAVSFISLKIETIPKFLILVGRNTLLIYIVHLMMLYGSAWNPGLALLFEKSLSTWETILVAIFMISAMTAMVIIINRFKIKNKEVVT